MWLPDAARSSQEGTMLRLILTLIVLADSPLVELVAFWLCQANGRQGDQVDGLWITAQSPVEWPGSS